MPLGIGDQRPPAFIAYDSERRDLLAQLNLLALRVAEADEGRLAREAQEAGARLAEVRGQ